MVNGYQQLLGIATVVTVLGLIELLTHIYRKRRAQVKEVEALVNAAVKSLEEELADLFDDWPEPPHEPYDWQVNGF